MINKSSKAASELGVYPKRQAQLAKYIGPLLIVCAALGLLASFMLTHDVLKLAADQSYDPACNISPLISCTSAMDSPTGTLVADLPNSLFGVIGFSMLLVFGVLVAWGYKLKKRIWQIASLAAAGGALLVHYLIAQSLYVLGSICPWCFVTWIGTMLLFSSILSHSLAQGYIGQSLPAPVRQFLVVYNKELLISWYLILLGLITVRFWDYWQTLL